MFEILNPTLIMEDRKLLPGQEYGRQQGIPEELEKLGSNPQYDFRRIDTLFIKADDPNTFDEQGRIQWFRRYGEEEYVNAVIENTGSYAWRMRAHTFDGGDTSRPVAPANRPSLRAPM